ncbi:metalloprotease family protein [Gorillibacterium timonense]|uniref:metalloprotease family protein n=1 Tax=Gorillibacterium timonense TaxID=1689269 RepID=UPI00071D09C8|nr:metalloprotease family protein [Gorillibacterium timonense]
MLIPGLGLILSIITFPGVIVHELAHQIFCYLCKLKVYEVKYFRVGNPCGYVIHETSDDPRKIFLVSMGPFFVNTLLGMIIVLPASIKVIAFEDYSNFSVLLLAWLGFSILMHAFPSTGDAKVMVSGILKNKKVGILPKVISAPFILLVYVGAIGSVVWLDAVYAVAVAMVVPDLLVHLI